MEWCSRGERQPYLGNHSFVSLRTLERMKTHRYMQGNENKTQMKSIYLTATIVNKMRALNKKTNDRAAMNSSHCEQNDEYSLQIAFFVLTIAAQLDKHFMLSIKRPTFPTRPPHSLL